MRSVRNPTAYFNDKCLKGLTFQVFGLFVGLWRHLSFAPMETFLASTHAAYFEVATRGHDDLLRHSVRNFMWGCEPKHQLVDNEHDHLRLDSDCCIDINSGTPTRGP